MPATPWTPAGEPVPIGHASTSLMVVEGPAFFLSDTDGDAHPGSPHGLFVGDTRFLDQVELRINGRALELLATDQPDAFAAVIVLRPRTWAGQPSRDVLVVRRRYLGLGLREDIEVRNFAPEPLEAELALLASADFADLFAVKEGRATSSSVRGRSDGRRLTFESKHDGIRRAVVLSFNGDGASTTDAAGHWRVSIPAGGMVTLCWDATVAMDATYLPLQARCGEQPERMESVRRARSWEGGAPVLATADERLRRAVAQSLDDVGALRIFGATSSSRPVIAAGAPWFMTLFGRDALLTAWMTLPLGRELALGVLEALALLQGKAVVPARDEQPGRILHELRFNRAARLELLAGDPYYGSADSSPLFVMLLAEAMRWGAPRDAVQALVPAADAALDWITTFGDCDGDGFVEYLRASPDGLANQGWKDSWDGIRYGDGRVAAAPLALCEVQAYVYAAYLARADLARWLGEPTGVADDLLERAASLRRRFHEQFWMEDAGTFAIALDADKRQVDSVTSNPGHCLWTGIADESVAGRVGATMVDPTLWSGWGIRTLSTANEGFNPMSYHCGSIWPHDNAIAVAGLARYGLVEYAQRVASALLDVADHDGGALPELFCGIDRSDIEVPVSYPTSCQPQAWSAAAPILILRSLLRLEPNAPDRVLRVAADAVPASWRPLSWIGIHLADQRVDVRVDEGLEVRGVPAGWTIEVT